MIRMAIIAAIAATPASAMTIRKDYGGAVDKYAAAVVATQEPVAIVGRCFSACTLYLGAGDVCVSKRAVLGFHGPSTQFPGIALAPAVFDATSARMAAFYPPAVSGWFMSTARFVTTGFYEVSGAELIRHGVKEC